LSAKEGRNVHAAMRILFDLQKQSQTKFATPKLNEVLQGARDKLLPQGRGQYPKLFYGTQVGTEPIQILVFVNEPKLFRGQYERYLARVLREAFGCPEVPIKIMFRRRDKIVLAPKGD
jgi:GTP-binding protein